MRNIVTFNLHQSRNDAHQGTLTAALTQMADDGHVLGQVNYNYPEFIVTPQTPGEADDVYMQRVAIVMTRVIATMTPRIVNSTGLAKDRKEEIKATGA